MKAIEDPPAAAVTTSKSVKASENSNFEMQILVDGAPIDVELEEGFAFVDLEEGKHFTVRAINNSSYEVGTELYLDGIHSNYYRGSRSFRIIQPGSQTDYAGWRTSATKIYKFKKTPFEESVAAETGSSTGQAGTIQLTFRSTWKPGDAPGMGYTPTSGIGRDRVESEAQEAIQVQREYGHQGN